VVLVRWSKVISAPDKVDSDILQRMVDRGLSSLTGELTGKDSVFHFYNRQDNIGMKVNCLGGKMAATHPELALAVFKIFERAGFEKKRFVMWDRTTQELKEAGFPINFKKNELSCLGTDVDGIGYTRDLFVHKNIGSLLSRIMTEHTNVQINLPVLKDHGMAGVTNALKNFFGAIHNPNKYHDEGCNPFVADLNSMPEIKNQNKLIICDALRVQYNGGPAYYPRWSEIYGGIILGTDPVAVDFIGYQIIERLRKRNNLDPLEKASRKPNYIFTAADSEHNLGKANLNDIELKEINLG